MNQTSIAARTAVIGLLASFALGASAKEASVGTVDSVNGNVSIGGNGFVSKAASGTALLDGATVLVSTTGRATVNLNNGCRIALSGGQHFTVDSKATCDQSQASVKQMFSPYRLAQAPVGGGAAGGGLGAGAGLGGLGIGLGVLGGIALIGIVTVENDDNKVSGS